MGARRNTGAIADVRREAVLAAAAGRGLLKEKSARIGVRVSPALVESAKRATGLASDTDLIELALANLAVDDDFATAFERAKGTLDPDLDLGL